jgi:hypothetical protein
MRETIEERLGQLKKEFQKGQLRLEELAQQRIQTEQTMLRIEGAIRLSEDLLSEQDPAASEPLAEVASLNR